MALNIKKYMFFVAFMIIASSFLPIIFNNLPPIIRSHHIWSALWLLSFVLFYPRLLFVKPVIFLLLYGLYLLVTLLTVSNSIDEWNQRLLLNEFYQISVGVTVITYFNYTSEYYRLAIIAKWSLFFFLITAIMTIVSASIDPMYARNIVGAALILHEGHREIIFSFKKYGGGGYGFAIAFMGLLPIIYYYLKGNIKISIKKWQILIFIFLILGALIRMQIFMNILIAGFIIPFCLVPAKNRKHIFFASVLLISMFLLIPKDIYVEGLYNVSDFFQSSSEVSNKFRDLAFFLDSGAAIDPTTGTGGRAERYPMLWNSFVQSPLMGCYFLTNESGYGYHIDGGHLHWMNKITVIGILGALLFSLIIFSFVHTQLKLFKNDYKYFFLLSAFSILLYGVFKTISGREAWYMMFILLPSMYFLQMNNDNMKEIGNQKPKIDNSKYNK